MCIVEIVDGVVLPKGKNQNKVDNARPIIAAVGSRGAHDEPSERIKPGYPPHEAKKPVSTPKEIPSTTPNTATTKPVAVDPITKVDYSMKLSANYTLGDLSTKAVLFHSIKAQHGLSVSEIVANLKAVAVNILEPLKAKYPGFKVNSGFRTSTGGKSQHERGEAVDIQFPGAPAAKYSEVAKWAAANLPYDQMIFEHGKSIWLHFSTKRTGGLRKMKLTYYPRKSPQYQAGLTNYYDGGTSVA